MVDFIVSIVILTLCSAGAGLVFGVLDLRGKLDAAVQRAEAAEKELAAAGQRIGELEGALIEIAAAFPRSPSLDQVLRMARAALQPTDKENNNG